MTRRKDIELAASLGAHAVGFIQVPSSSRFVPENELVHLSRLAQSLGLETIGVFQNQNVDEIKNSALKYGFSGVQLHGDEKEDVCEELKKTGLKVIKTLAVEPSSVSTSSSLPASPTTSEPSTPGPLSLTNFWNNYHMCDAILADTKMGNTSGGTGKAFDWEKFKATLPEVVSPKLIVAGGVGPENVEKLLATLSPCGLDINSAVEDSPGVKNHALMKKLVNILSK